jgi:hypothetical protein
MDGCDTEHHNIMSPGTIETKWWRYKLNYYIDNL